MGPEPFTVSIVMPEKPLEQKIPALLKFFARRNLSHWDAEDLAQEVLCKLLVMGRSPTTEQDAYLYAVARTLLIDKYRSDARRKATAHTGFNEEDIPDSNYSTPEMDYMEYQLANILSSRFQNLTALQQQTFIAQRLQGKSIQSIADERRVSVSAVEKVASKANRKLREGIK